jgi:hypothetical protein
MDLNLHTLYLVCAIVGGGLLVVQFLLMIFGMDDHADADVSDFELDEAGVGGNIFFGYLSIKAVVAFLTFFGLGGLLAETIDGIGSLAGVGIACALGIAAFYVVAFIMVSLKRLDASGNVDIEKAVGHTATVYLKIPANKSGAGKVTVSLQDRSVEVRAVTGGEELGTGSQVRVIAVQEGPTLEVAALS